jgi:hypothetical protein
VSFPPTIRTDAAAERADMYFNAAWYEHEGSWDDMKQDINPDRHRLVRMKHFDYASRTLHIRAAYTQSIFDAWCSYMDAFDATLWGYK